MPETCGTKAYENRHLRGRFSIGFLYGLKTTSSSLADKRSRYVQRQELRRAARHRWQHVSPRRALLPRRVSADLRRTVPAAPVTMTTPEGATGDHATGGHATGDHATGDHATGDHGNVGGCTGTRRHCDRHRRRSPTAESLRSNSFPANGSLLLPCRCLAEGLKARAPSVLAFSKRNVISRPRPRPT